jgi:Domain of unknown function (DUF4388)
VAPERRATPPNKEDTRMALNGELTDLSLAELIEFFCNQRKTGRLAVEYPQGSAYFHLQAGAVVHASIGTLRGIEAVYYALTLANASFNFDSACEAPEHTINQPWTSVVLEGLRRMDEGISARSPFPEKVEPVVERTVAVEPEPAKVDEPAIEQAATAEPDEEINDEIVVDEPRKVFEQPAILPVSNGFLSSPDSASRFAYGPWKLGAIFAALILIVGGIAVPWGWYARGKAAKLANETKPLTTDASETTASQPATTTETPAAQPTDDASTPATNPEATDLAKKEREARAREEARLRAKAAEANSLVPATQSSQVTPPPTAPAQSSSSASKKVVVQVTYDENGRVTQATGNDPTALRIARQKRFPAGKAGSATVTIPIN